jgi:hypothetical protein
LRLLFESYRILTETYPAAAAFKLR